MAPASATTSILIPTYGAAPHIGEAIESALAQTVPVEIVVIDDGSPVDVGAVVDRYPGVRLHRQENAGCGAARNAGLSVSSGEYVIFLDDDDRLLPRAAELGSGMLDADPDRAFASGWHRHIDAEGSLIGVPIYPTDLGTDLYEELLRRNWAGMTGAIIYRRSALERIGGYDTSFRWVEDYDLNLRLASRFPAASFDEIVAEYRLAEGTMSQDSRAMLRGALLALRNQRPTVRSRPSYREAYRQGQRVWRSVYGDPIAQRVAEGLGGGRPRASGRDVATLARWYPRGLARAVAYRRRG